MTNRIFCPISLDSIDDMRQVVYSKRNKTIDSMVSLYLVSFLSLLVVVVIIRQFLNPNRNEWRLSDVPFILVYLLDSIGWLYTDFYCLLCRFHYTEAIFFLCIIPKIIFELVLLLLLQRRRRRRRRYCCTGVSTEASTGVSTDASASTGARYWC